MRITLSTKPIYEKDEVEGLLAIVDTAHALKELIITGVLNPRFEGRRYYPPKEEFQDSTFRRCLEERAIDYARDFLHDMQEYTTYTSEYRERKAFGSRHCYDFNRVEAVIRELEMVVKTRQKERRERTNQICSQ